MADSSSTTSPFFDEVYRVVQNIPRGYVATYGQVAALAGSPRAARYVGFALHSNPDPSLTPCHRVVFRDGSLSPGYAFGGPERQRELLEDEGVCFKMPRTQENAGAPGWVVDFDKSAWQA
ncbi:methylated-DNA--protein-cysteine methyltransferase [Bombiscardovia apis]|uniref:Methylated-DNA--protein-cysteine methyltransferase n=1 Tax=Bombiscardovia apis TaxID=2932182 RepID=A0ABN6SGP7_9BIFI|nr:MGMT family protein [Bombiscardovia apis]BDR54421.1 methylated-DNA--protein-cysteine methyltransferase [Bombiscardovia apis]